MIGRSPFGFGQDMQPIHTTMNALQFTIQTGDGPDADGARRQHRDAEPLLGDADRAHPSRDDGAVPRRALPRLQRHRNITQKPAFI